MTSKAEALKRRVDKFPWGEVVKVHQIGDFDIIEYIVNSCFEDGGTIEFQTGEGSYPTLDLAIIGILCEKYAEPEAVTYITRILGIREST